MVKLGHEALMFVRDRWPWTALGSGVVGVAAVTVAWEVMPPTSECLNSGVDGVSCGAAQGMAGLVFAFPQHSWWRYLAQSFSVFANGGR